MNKPIFIVGNPGSGTALLCAILNWHKDVGPKHLVMIRHKNINHFIDGLADKKWHWIYNELTEQTETWNRILPDTELGQRGFLDRLSKEVLKQQNTAKTFEQLTEDDRQWIANRLSGIKFSDGQYHHVNHPRYLSKRPENLLRLRHIKWLFEDSIIIALVRSGRGVIGARAYQDGGSRTSIDRELGNWYNGLFYLSQNKSLVNQIVVYEDLLADVKGVSEKVFETCCLTDEEYLGTIKVQDRTKVWSERIAPEHHEYIIKETERGDALIETWKSR